MAVIIIDICESEAEEIAEMVSQMNNGLMSEEQFKEGLMQVLGDALPRGPERNDEIRLQVVKKTQVGWTKGAKIVN